MKFTCALLVVSPVALAFAPSAPAASAAAAARRSPTAIYAYVPSGMSPAEWKAMQAKEKAVKDKKYGVNGPRGYKSRSFNSFVEALERGEATHLLPVDPRKVKSGEIPIEEVPYMQRPGGAWDGSDLRGTAKKRAVEKQKQGMYTAGVWLDSDRKYEAGGKNKVNSFFAQFGAKEEDVQTRAKKNGISNDAQMWRDAGAMTPQQITKMKRNCGAPKIGQPPQEKKFFGLF